MSLNQVKRWTKNHIPRFMFNAIQGMRKKFVPEDAEKVSFKAKFDELNKGLDENRIAMRPGMIWNIDPQSHDPFSWFCYQSPDMTHEFDRFLEDRKGKKRFLDIGANHGVYSLAFTHGRPETQSIAVDPSPLAFPILQRNIALNPEMHIRPRQVAAGDRAGELRMKLSWHHLEVISDQTAAENDEIKIVPVRTMDSLCEEENFVPELIKVDVEGFELQCIKGLEKTLTKHRPEFILEIHPELIEPLDYTLEDLIQHVLDLKYSFSSLSGQKLEKSFLVDQIHVHWVVCTPQ